MTDIFRSKAFWVCLFFLAAGLVMKCVFDPSGLPCGLSISSPPPDGCKNLPYSHTFYAHCGQEPYTWKDNNTLPSWLKLDSSSGVLSGTPTQNGKYSFTIEVIDAKKQNSKETYTISIDDLNITNSQTAFSYCPGEAIDIKLTACGGTGSLTWSLKSGTLPSGVSVKSDGRIAGTTSDTGTFNFLVLVSDAGGKQAEKDFTLKTVAWPIILSPSRLPQGETTKAYTAYQLKACGGSPPYTWTDVNTDIPAGLSLSSSGLITGTPTKAGDYKFLVELKDAKYQVENYFLLKVVASNTLAITTTSPLPGATECKSYSTTLTGSGGTGSYTWKVASSSQLPKGLLLSSLGILSGTPSLPSTTPYSFDIELSDTKSTVTGTFNLTVSEDATVTPDLIVIRVRQASGVPFDSISLASLSSTTTVKVDFRFATASTLQSTTPQAKLQVVGSCTTIATTDIPGPVDVDLDGVLEKVARFDPQQVATLLGLAGKNTAGSKATLRFWVDVLADKKTETYIQKMDVTIVK